MHLVIIILNAIVVYILIGLIAPIIALEHKHRRLSVVLSYMIYVPFIYLVLGGIVLWAYIADHCDFVLTRE